jgi:hypothetical protein
MTRRSAFLPSNAALLALALAAVPAFAAPTTRSGAAGSGSATRAATADPVFADAFDHRGSSVTVYTDRAAFLAALAPGRIELAFDEVMPGHSPPLHYLDQGFSLWLFTPPGTHHGLYNGPGFVSTDQVDEPLMVWTTLEDRPIGAIGGQVWPSDFSLRPTDGRIGVDVILQDGTLGATAILDAADPDSFVGFVSHGEPIAYLLIEAPDIVDPPAGTTPDRWPTLDNLVVGGVQ